VTWVLDRVSDVAGLPTKAIGHPTVSSEGGPSLVFDGANDGLFVETNPLQGLTRFTVEAIIEPAKDGAAEQRFFHMQETGADVRALLELRLDPDGTWCLDTFLRQSATSSRTLIDRTKRHPAGAWHAVALVYDGVMMSHYVDGVKEAEGPVSFVSDGAGRTSVGVRQNLVSWFKGRIRTIRVTSSPLAPEQMLTVR
jgi:hypothetical protein